MTNSAVRRTRPEDIPPGRHILADLEGLSPAYFGMVMATGIISIAAHLLAMPRVAQILFHLNVAVYGVFRQSEDSG